MVSPAPKETQDKAVGEDEPDELIEVQTQTQENAANYEDILVEIKQNDFNIAKDFRRVTDSYHPLFFCSETLYI